MVICTDNFFRLLTVCLLTSIGMACSEQSGPPLPTESDASVDAGMSTRTLKIISPAAGATISAADDLDNEPNNGAFQIKVTATMPRGVFGNATLTVNGAQPQDKPIESDSVDFDVSLPAEMNNSYVLAVKATGVDGTDFRDSVTVNVRVDNTIQDCTVQIDPVPIGGCDITGPDADEDQAKPFVQKTFTATSNCPTVSFSVNGRPGLPVSVANGIATQQLTLEEGDNQITVTASNEAGNDTTLGPLAYSVKTSVPRFTVTGPDGRPLNGSRENNFFVDSGTQTGGKVFWTISGTVQGALAGGDVTIALESERAGQAPAAPAQVTTDNQGNFSFDVEIADGAFWGGTLTVTAADVCMQSGDSPRYAIQLDAVVPSVRIVSPSDDTLLVGSQDIDPSRAGVQIPVSVELIDVRPSAVDYEISIECAAVAQNRTFFDRASGNDTVTRSELNDGNPNNDSIIVTFLSTEEGEFLCRPKIVAQSNPPTVTTSVWRTFFSQPTLTVVQPTAVPRCIEVDSVDLIALGGNLDGNEPSLTVTVTPEGGMPGQPLPLQPAGGERYTYNFDAASLPDGRYTLDVTGTVRGIVPIEVTPETLNILVDRVPVTIDILSPANNGVFQDAQPEIPGTQASVQVRVCGAAGRQVTVSFAADTAIDPLVVDVPEGEDCVDVSTSPTSMPLGSVAVTADVTDACNRSASATVTASTGANEARIMSPENGTQLNATADRDPARGGCQLVIETIADGIAEGAEMAVCTSVAQGPASPLCSGRAVANDQPCSIVGATANGARIQCAVTLQKEEHTLTFVGQFGGRIESPPVTVTADCTAPTVRNIQITQDANADGCVNAAERGDGGDSPELAQVSVQFETTDLANDTPFEVRLLDGNVLAAGTIVNNAGSANMTLGQGTQRFYIFAADAVGNSLRTPADEGFVPTQITVDTVVPNPSLENLSSASCLVAQDDVNPVEGFQYEIQVTTGRSENEAVTAVLTVDGDVGNSQSLEESADQVTFDAVTLAEGAHTVTVTVADGCGNVGSVSGFNQADPAQPNTVDVVVDTIAPSLTLDGVNNGAQFDANDDADGDASNGFQVGVGIVFAPFDGIEAGQTVDVFVNDAPTTTSPSPITVPEALNASIPVFVTISPGNAVLTARAADVCGNIGATAPVGVQLDIDGCTSRITGFDTSPTFFGVADSANDVVTQDINGVVDLLDASCASATVDLVDLDDDNNANVLATEAVGDGGAVRFSQLVLGPGSYNLALRVTAGAAPPVFSAVQAITVDLVRPVVSIVSPQEGAFLASNGNISVNVTEVAGTTRTAQLFVGGNAIGEATPVGDGESVPVLFANQNLPAGNQELRICVTDKASNQGCVAWRVIVDDGVPGAPNSVSVSVVDPRETRITLNLDAPAEDGEGIGGPVTAYEIRRLDENVDLNGDNIPDDIDVVTRAWDKPAAATSTLVVANNTGVGEAVTVTIAGTGPGPALADGLPLDDVYYLAVRARDDVGRLSEPRLVSVDLRFNQRTVDFDAAWTADKPDFDTSPIHNIGDVDGDGLNDILVTIVTQGAQVSSVVFGAATGDPIEKQDILKAQNAVVDPSLFGYGGGSVGDVNGDGIPDFALIGFQPALVGSAISIYLGANNDRQAIIEPDAVIYVDGFRSVVAGAGEFNRLPGDAAAIEDVFIGSDFNGSDQFAFVVAGRIDWPALPNVVRVSTDAAQNDAGTTVLSVPLADGQKTGYSVASVGDLDGDGFATLALSAGLPTNVYLFDGGADLPATMPFSVDNAATRVLTETCSIGGDGFGEFIVGGGVDLDGDAESRPDFIVTNSQRKRVMIVDQSESQLDCFGRTDRGFGDKVNLAGDINGDGFQDLIVSHFDDGRSDAYIFYNDGNGIFGADAAESPRLYDVRLDQPGLRKLGVAGLGDFNNDSRADIGVIVKQPGAGNFQLVIYE